MNMHLCNYFAPMVTEGAGQMADTMKSLVYHEEPTIFDFIDFDDDYPFLEPLLFAYFNRGEQPFDLIKILVGYSKTDLIDQITFCGHNPEYLPNRGYYIADKEGRPHCQSPLLNLDENLSAIRQQHDLLRNYFQDGNNLVVEVEIEQTTPLHFESCKTALSTIRTHLPALYSELIKTNRNILMFFNPQVFCFSTIQSHGIAYLSAIPENARVFFLEELIHQCAHNTFNTILFDKQRFFKIDIEKANMGDFLNNRLEKRTIFSAFHGLYTVAKRYEAFHLLYRKGVFSGEERHEFLGRFADLEKRFKTGLERLILKEIFTQEGIEIFEQLFELCEAVIEDTKELRGAFQLQNQPAEFSYRHFLELNPFL